MSDDLIERIANGVEEPSFLDLHGIMAKRKKDRERAEFRMQIRQEQRAEIAGYIRSFKEGHGNDPLAVLQEIATHENDEGLYFLRLTDAWPLCWRGLCDIHAVIKCNSNSLPPEMTYRVRLTEKGRKLLNGPSPPHQEDK